MRKYFLAGLIIGALLLLANISIHSQAEESSPVKFLVNTTLNLRAGVKGADFERGEYNRREALENEYKHAPGLIAVFGYKGKESLAREKHGAPPAHYGYIELWDNAENAQKFWTDPERSSHFQEIGSKIANKAVFEFTAYDVVPVVVSELPKAKFLVNTMLNLRAGVKGADFERGEYNRREALENEYKHAPGLIAVFGYKGKESLAREKHGAPPAHYGYIELWDNAENAQKFWTDPERSSHFQEIGSKIANKAVFKFTAYDVVPVL